MDIGQVVALIEELYSSRPSKDITKVQQELQVIQKSNEGFALANELLNNDTYSPNIKYFGALTLTVQLTTHVDSYEALWKLFKTNLLQLTKFSTQYLKDSLASAPLIITIKKLMSNLSLIFTNINELDNVETSNAAVTHWNNPINTFVQLVSHAEAFASESWMDTTQTDRLMHQLINSPLSYNDLMQFINSSDLCNKLTLMFTEIIVEDLIKFQSRKTSMNKIYETVHDHLYISTMALIDANIVGWRVSDDILFNCISAWINYISMARNVSPHGRMDLSEMFDHMINRMCLSSLESDNFYQAEKILSIFANVFANDPILMGHPQREQLEVIFLGVSRSGNADASKNAWMLQYMNHLVANEMADELKELAVCLVDFLQINTLDMCNKLFTVVFASSLGNESLQQYIKTLLQLTNFPLTPVMQEFFSVRMVDFWLDLADCYSNTVPETLTEQAPVLAIEIFQQVVNIYLPKISLLNKQKVIQDGDDDSLMHEFGDFRSAIADLMGSLWSILGNDKLTNILITGIGENTFSADGDENVDIFQIEAMSFLLNTLLTDMNLAESPWVCDVLDSCKYFVRNVLMLLQAGCQSSSDSPAGRALKQDFVRTSSTLIGTMAGYFQQSPSQLSICIDALFQGLEKCTIPTTLDDKHLNDRMEVMIIKAISTLCDTCRQELLSYLPQFVSVFNTIMRPDANISTFTRERLTRSMGYIIESRVDEGPDKQAICIFEVISTVESYIRGILSSSEQPSTQQKNYVHCLLSCISELGASMIHPDEIENKTHLQKLSEFQNFWHSDPMQISYKVLNLLQMVLSNPFYAKDMAFVEVSCLVLGNALGVPTEEPHFLRYSMNDIMNFLLEHTSITELTSALPYYVYLLEKMIKQYKEQLSPQDFDFIFENFFSKHYQSTIVDDPDLIQTMLNFVNSVLDCKPSLAVHSTFWMSLILPESMKLLIAKEKFTITAVTKFWIKVFNNKKYDREDYTTTQQQMLAMGQEIVFQALYGLYHCQRSDLNSYADLLRAMMAKQPLQMPKWLVAVLPNICNNNKAHEKLVSKLSVTRGSRAANSAILEWWLSCNALPTL
ncbi:KAP122 (YGL016W) [Zygosaccharomyces parabailii]|nr:KAP122 (YGL016W) [Zygosaccharomyces parabailii]